MVTGLNHMPRPILGDRTPLEVMLGRATQMPAELVFFKGPNLADATQVDINSKIVNKYCSKLVKKIDDVNIELNNDKAAAEARRLAKSKNKLPRFKIGDFVCIARHEKHLPHKVCLHWNGPFEVTGYKSEFVILARLLGSTSQSRPYHISRVKPFAAAAMGQPVGLQECAQNDYKQFEVDDFIAWRLDDHGVIELRVQWQGFPDDEDCSWEPIDSLLQDVPVKVQQFLQKHQREDKALQHAYNQL